MLAHSYDSRTVGVEPQEQAFACRESKDIAANPRARSNTLRLQNMVVLGSE
jgi:hypothetical protein